MSRHLTNGNGDKKKSSDRKSKDGKDEDEDEEEEAPLSERDYQLYEALNLLKGLSLQREQLR